MICRPELLTRRRVLRAGAGLVAGLAGAQPGIAAAAKLMEMPEQSLGPYYPDRLPLDIDNDLVTIKDGAPSAGQVVHVMGRLTDTAGRAISGARVEIWQCDIHGRYIHTEDTRPDKRDENFQGYGTTVTAADGAYRFRTIKPVPYSGRTPHIHFAIKGPGDGRLITQMYVEGEPRNDDDFLLGQIRNPRARRALLVPFAPAPEIEANALAGRFDIVLGRGFWPFR